MNPLSTPALLTAFLAAGTALYCGVVARQAWSGYRAYFQDTATRNLSEMFLFLDSRQLFAANFALMALVCAVVLLLDGGLLLASVLPTVLAFAPAPAFAWLRRRRLRTTVAQLPDALLSISNSLRAGMSLPQALEALMIYQHAPLGQELALLLRELRVGVPYGEALDNLNRRLPEVEIQLVTAAMRVSREVGGNLAETFERISDTLRRRLQMEGKIRSLTAQGQLQGLVMTGLPVFLIIALYQLEPRAMRYLFTEWYGWATLAVIGTLEAAGYHFIRKIVNVDV